MNLATHPMWLVVGSLLIALVPILIGVVTSYLKVSIVLGMLKNALGTQQVPGGTIIMALSLALTAFIMAPVFKKTGELAQHLEFSKIEKVAPNAQTIGQVGTILRPWQEFMQNHVGQKELAVFAGLAEGTGDSVPSDEKVLAARSSLRILIPAFVLTELKQGFAMAFLVILPFLVIDLIVANILVGMGMTMVSPVMISLPLKLLLFVASDGWLLLVRGLVNSYQ